MSSIKSLTQKVKRFCRDRDWHQFHNHKDMSISLALEAAEVMEHFQWMSSVEMEEHVKKSREEIGEELADVAKYLFELADNIGVDLSAAIESKMKKDGAKYPIKKSKGNHLKYNKL